MGLYNTFISMDSLRSTHCWTVTVLSSLIIYSRFHFSVPIKQEPDVSIPPGKFQDHFIKLCWFLPICGPIEKGENLVFLEDGMFLQAVMIKNKIYEKDKQHLISLRTVQETIVFVFFLMWVIKGLHNHNLLDKLWWLEEIKIISRVGRH